MKRAFIFGLAALACATPLAAQDAAATGGNQTSTIMAYSVTPVSAADLPAPDPERLAVAERLVDRIWPLGTYRRMMESTMSGLFSTVDGVEAAPAEWMGDDSKEARRARHEARTGRRIGGPAAEPRPEPSLEAMNAALLPIFERIEPPMRAAIARIYARRYDLTQLGELDAFFSTPTGAAYAADSLMLMNDPEMVAAMQASTLEIMSAIPTLIGAAMGDAGLAEAAADTAAEAATSAAAIKAE